MERVGTVRYINISQFQGKSGCLFGSRITLMQGGASISNNLMVLCEEKNYVNL
jgi:hypothetical protein